MRYTFEKEKNKNGSIATAEQRSEIKNDLDKFLKSIPPIFFLTRIPRRINETKEAIVLDKAIPVIPISGARK